MIDNNAKAPDLQNVEPSSDADAIPVPEIGQTPKNPNNNTKSAPLETDDSKQADDNIDDKGNKSGGGQLNQPT